MAIEVILKNSSGETLYPRTAAQMITTYAILQNPAIEFTIWDSTYGRVCALDSVTPYMTFADSVWDVMKIRFSVVSGNSDISGDMALIPIIDGVEGEEIIIPVGGSTAYVTYIPEERITGLLQFKRDTTSANDTLKDNGSVVAALIVNMELEVVHQ